ncbi:MAG: hypothetical protein GX359_10485 [Clostridiales bacterium]|nr:hypothetical protein [Clostridiales bacterium]
MDKIKKLIREFSLSLDIINVLLGILLMIFLILIFTIPHNSLLLFMAFATGGIMNIVNGLKYKKDPKRRNMGMLFILFGFIVIFIGYLMVAMG